MAVELQPVKPVPMSVWRCTLLALSTLPLMFTAPPPVLSVRVPALPLLSTPKTTWVSVLLTLPKSIAPPVPVLAEVLTVWFEVAWKLMVSAVAVKLPPPVLTSPSNAITPP